MKFKTRAAQCAAAIRQELKQTFPQIKFKITSSTFSMGDSVRISWNDGVPTETVSKIVDKYQYGHFNGMEDIYECTNRRDDLPQAKWVQVERTISDEIYLEQFEILKEKWDFLKEVTDINASSCAFFDKSGGCWTARNFIYRQINGMDFSKKIEVKPLQQIFDGAVKIVDYSEKAIAVFGDTKPLKEKLKALGGRFNPFLMNNGEKMAGWIFPKSKSLELSQILNVGV